MNDSSLPCEWHVASIHELGGFKRDAVQTGPFGAQLHAEDYVDEGIPLILIRNIKDNGLDERNIPKVTEEDAERLSRYRLKVGDIVFSRVGRVGSCFLATRKQEGWLISGQTLRMRTDKKLIHPTYLIYALRTEKLQNSLIGESVGSTRTSINTTILENLEVNVPPLPEQQKIANILTSVDEVIAKTQAQIDKLKDLKTGMMQELLTNGIGHTEFKDSPVGRIPAEWSVDTLDSISKVIDCKHATPKYYPVGYAVVKPGNIKEGNLDLSSCALTDKAGFDNLNENHLPVIGDTIYSRNQTYGIGAYVNKAMSFAVGQDVCIIHPKKCEPKFTYYVVNSPVVREQVELLAAGSTFKRINLGSIRKLFIPVPTKTEQVLISNALSSIDEKMEYILAKLKSLKMTKKALMQDLLTGKVRVKVS